MSFKFQKAKRIGVCAPSSYYHCSPRRKFAAAPAIPLICAPLIPACTLPNTDCRRLNSGIRLDLGAPDASLNNRRIRKI
eukprot:1778578-Pyramimonas_sp.AAC.1